MISCAFSTLDELYAVVRLAPQAFPSWATDSEFFISITRTTDELSIVCASQLVPEGVAAEHGWRCVKLDGSFAFDQVGILASIANPLAAKQIGIFAISTFDTDYILLKELHLEAAISALKKAGHRHLANQI